LELELEQKDKELKNINEKIKKLEEQNTSLEKEIQKMRLQLEDKDTKGMKFYLFIF
jgi:predicted  nucleic acid-binding Zn-ribbon protein